MLEKIRLKYQNNFTWIYTSKYVLYALILSAISILIDTKFTGIHKYVPYYLLTSRSLAQTILSSLVSAIITITTFTFSTTMVVLTMYSSQFSPRVVENFLSEKTTLKVLGIFMGGFFYSITALLFMKNADENQMFISATIGVIYAIVCLIHFALFIFKVSSSIQANNLIAKLFEEAGESIKTSVDEHGQYVVKSYIEKEEYRNTYIMHSNRNGYVQSISHDMILSKITLENSVVEMKIKNGDFIVLGQPIAKIYTNEELIDEEEENLIDEVNKCVVVDKARNITYDYMFAIQKIVDITLRAISPGINDPNTAIECINILGVLLSKMSKESGKICIRENKKFNTKIVYGYFDFKNDIYNTFYQIVTYGKEDVSVVIAILKALENITYYASKENISAVNDIKEYVLNKTEGNFKNKIDIDKIKEYL